MNSELSQERTRLLNRFLHSVNLGFDDLHLLNEAFTHKSYTNEFGKNLRDNERLEFLGDSVLGLVTNEFLYHKYPHYSEGKLSRIKAKLVSEEALSKVALELDLSFYLLLGKGEKETGGQNRKSNLANSFEAFLGALFLDQGFFNVKNFMERFLISMISHLSNFESVNDYKTILQEYSQKKFKKLPDYELISEQGPDHNKVFKIQVKIDSKVSIGEGSNKKRAEQDAARLLLNLLKG